ncbi:hypothetical protein EOPP23_02905 [Endozoicomonas sp. OPT23]|uniref:hypothetical protein n=1 Tax=Endozoicomonas sp. OPT23 TaxID=2072845 RepID=UPI00129B23A6|nr:hypothetical protein [Endozoicomonas sp. OPT23]MRI31947.1 hypothetical protein [Endozoicomonas sp. OPT23]
MKNRIITIFSWVVVAWTAKVFLSSLPYKFTGHPDTQYIFGTIGGWMQGILGNTIGNWFANYGAIAVGIAELTVSLFLLIPLFLFIREKLTGAKSPVDRAVFHTLGGLAAAGVMTGAAFFHLATPLGIVVLHEGKSDGGSLFFAAVSILVLGLIMAAANFSLIKERKLNGTFAH